MDYLPIIACVFLLLFTMVATIDGLYFHLYKYKLFTRADSKKEHLLHTLNAFLFPITIVLFFVFNVSGLLLWAAVFLTVVTLIIEFLDVFEERSSRQTLGGLTSLEYSMHFAMSGLRATYTALILGTKPFFAWSLLTPWILQGHPYPLSIRVIGAAIAIMGVPVFILHWYLGGSLEKK